MRKRIFLWLQCLCILVCQGVEAYNCRDYWYTTECGDEPDEIDDEGTWYCWSNSSDYCLFCCLLKSDDQYYRWDDFYYVNDGGFYCNWYGHSFRNHYGIDFDYLPTFRDNTRESWLGTGCYSCDSSIVYSGYLHFLYRDDFPFLKKQIAYVKKNPKAKVFWPECSDQALAISNMAVLFFKDLIDSTSLRRLKYDINLANKFMVSSWCFSQMPEIIHIALCASCFHFSDYFQVCQDIKAFSKKYFNSNECATIESRLEDFLDRLAPLFRANYDEFLAQTPMPEIQIELEIIQDLYNEWGLSTFICPICKGSLAVVRGMSAESLVGYPEALPRVETKSSEKSSQRKFEALAVPDDNPNPPNWCLAPQHYARGRVYNENGCFNSGIDVLSKAITLNPSFSHAYLERAHAYFETGQFDLALADYRTYTSLAHHFGNRAVPSGTLEFSHGLCKGVLEGSHVAVTEFGPSLVSSTYGLLNGLWAFACSPAEVSQELITRIRALIGILRSQSSWESLQMMVPELQELCCQWDMLDDYQRGNKTGYIVGKYGIDIFLPYLGVKAVQAYQAFRAANTAFTLECLAQSAAKEYAITQQSLIRAAKRAEQLQRTFCGRLVLKNAAQAKHILGEHHEWSRVVAFTGNVEEDCCRILRYLEQHQVVQPVNMVKDSICYRPPWSPRKITADYRKQVGNITVEVVMETDIVSGETAVQNAYVVTR